MKSLLRVVDLYRVVYSCVQFCEGVVKYVLLGVVWFCEVVYFLHC